MYSDHLILCRPLLLPSIFPSIRDFSNELGVWIMWPEYWSFSFSISPSNEYSRLISFKIDWFDLLAVEGTLKMVEWNHQFNEHEIMQTLGNDEGQGSLACCMQSVGLQRVWHDLATEQQHVKWPAPSWNIRNIHGVLFSLLHSSSLESEEQKRSKIISQWGK